MQVKHYFRMSTIILFVGILCRIIPHMANFTFVMPLIAGSYRILPARWSIAAVASMLLMSDFILSIVYGIGANQYQWLFGNYLAYSLVILLAFLYRFIAGFFKKLLFDAILLPSIFWLITNLYVFVTSTMYSKDLAGLIQCFVLALPFLMIQILSSILGSVMFQAVTRKTAIMEKTKISLVGVSS